MKTYEQKQVTYTEVTHIKCDKCGVEYDVDDPQVEEFLSWHTCAGYYSLFGDGAILELDLCGQCVYDLLGRYVRQTGFEF